jgi:hypothetical protein
MRLFYCLTLKLAFKLFFYQAEVDGSNEFNDFEPASLNTTNQLIKDLKNIDVVLHIGDIAYANGYLSQWDQFTAQVEPIASTVPYMVARFVQDSNLTTDQMMMKWNSLNMFLMLLICGCSGNHERDWPGSGSFYGNLDSGGECGVPAQNMFYVPAENREQFWYENFPPGYSQDFFEGRIWSRLKT